MTVLQARISKPELEQMIQELRKRYTDSEIVRFSLPLLYEQLMNKASQGSPLTV